MRTLILSELFQRSVARVADSDLQKTRWIYIGASDFGLSSIPLVINLARYDTRTQNNCLVD